MRRHTVRAAALAALALAAWPGPAGAQVEIGVRGSTLGAGAEVSYRLAPRLALRATGNILSLTRDEEVEGISYELRPRLRSAGAQADLYPFGRVLYLTGGLVLNKNKATAEAVIGQTITIGNRTYTNTEIQSLRGDLEWERALAPYAGLGFSTGGRVGFGLEIGVVFSGTPTVTLSGETTLTGAERQAFDTAVAQEEAEVRVWIDDNRRWTKYYPVVAAGLRIRL
jgi:hypothetical protein